MTDRRPRTKSAADRPHFRSRGILQTLAERDSRQLLLLIILVTTVGVAVALAAGPPSVIDGVALDAPAPDGPNATVVEATDAGGVTIEYRTDGDRERVTVGAEHAIVADGAGWAVLDRDVLPPPLSLSADDPLAGTPAAGVAPVGEHVLVGEFSASTGDLGDATVTVVTPAGMGTDPDVKSHHLSSFLSDYSFGPHGTDATIVLLPDTLPHRGGTYADGTAYVTVPEFWDGQVASVWLHEYVHLRQGYDADTEMTWFTEASAEYLSFRIMEEQYGEVTDDDVRSRLDSLPDHPDAALSEPSTWDGESVDYTRGPRLLYAVDAVVRIESDGEYTLFDVFEALNERNQPLTVESFRETVENHTGTDEPWIEDAITESGAMDDYREYGHVFNGD